MEEIIVIRVTDSDGSIFQAIADVLKTKPLDLLAIAHSNDSVLKLGDLELRPSYHQASIAGREIRLNHGEYAMLYCMASSPGQVFSKAQLYAAAWGEEYLHGTNSVENIIWRLRKKLEDDPKHPAYIKTVIGAGYRLQISTEEEHRK